MKDGLEPPLSTNFSIIIQLKKYKIKFFHPVQPSFRSLVPTTPDHKDFIIVVANASVYDLRINKLLFYSSLGSVSLTAACLFSGPRGSFGPLNTY